MKLKEKVFFMCVAEGAARLSHAVRLKVGAVAVKDGNILAFGYNGTPAGMDNCCEFENPDGTLTTKPNVIHAEVNLIGKIAQSGQSSYGCSVIVTHAPCNTCATTMIAAGVKEVFYRTPYRDTTGVQTLEEAGIPCTLIES